MNADLIVVWDGGHRGVDADLLCVFPAKPVEVTPIPVEHWDTEIIRECRTNRRRAEVLMDRQTILDVLAHGRVVKINDLREQTGLTGLRQLEIALIILRQQKLVRSVGYGRIQIGRRASQVRTA